MSQEKDTPRIITKKTGKIKWTISNALGGIGRFDIVLIVMSIAIITPLLSFLSAVGVITDLLLVLLIILITITLIQVDKNGNKFYFLLWRFVKFMFINKKESNIFDILKINSFKNNQIYYNNQVALVFRIEAKNINLETQSERNETINSLSKIMKMLSFDFEIFKTEVPYNFNEKTKHLDNLINSAKNKVVKYQLDQYKKEISKITDFKGYQNNFYFIIYGNDIVEIRSKIQFIVDTNHEFRLIESNENEIAYILSKLTVPTKDAIEKPEIVHQFKNYFKIDDKYVTYLTISTYPTIVYDSWLTKLANIPNVNLNIKIKNISQYKAIEMLDEAIKRAEMQSPRKISEKNTYDEFLVHFHELLNLVQSGGEDLKMVSLIFTCFADDKKQLNNIKDSLINELSAEGFIVDDLNYQQLDTYKFIWNDKRISKKESVSYWQEMPISSLASCWPFINNSLNDHRGVLMGENENGNSVFFDVETKDTDRSNGNVVVLGLSGKGKTTTVKKQLNWLHLNGGKIFIIDPESEYTNFSNYHGGEVIYIGNSANEEQIINPLEIFTGNIMEHISFVEQFIKILYPDLDNKTLSDFQKLLLESYEKKGIDKSITKHELEKMKSSNFPTFKDLFEFQNKKEIKNKDKSILYKILWKLGIGADGYLWNGQTTLSLTNDLIVFNIHELSANKARQNAQLFIMLAFLEKQAKEHKRINDPLPEDKRQWLTVAIDEAHLLINENNMLALNFVSGLAKRIRKYHGGIYIISQNINDFVGNANIKTQSQAIINNCVYQFVHFLAPSDLKNYDDLISSSKRLNQYHKEILSNAPKGTCLFSINNKRMLLNVSLFNSEIEAIGKGN